MRLNISLFILTLFISFIASTTKAEAFMKQHEPSATLVSLMPEKKMDERVAKLQAYLKYYNSPMADDAEAFITYADAYNLDWRLVVSISGVESGYGKHIPAYSYNGWGWGVYGNNVRHFTSWEDGIAVISKSLRVDYMDKRGAKTTYDIGRTYAANPEWASRVEYFMAQLDAFDPEAVKKTNKLAISL